MTRISFLALLSFLLVNGAIAQDPPPLLQTIIIAQSTARHAETATVSTVRPLCHRPPRCFGVAFSRPVHRRQAGS